MVNVVAFISKWWVKIVIILLSILQIISFILIIGIKNEPPITVTTIENKETVETGISDITTATHEQEDIRIADELVCKKVAATILVAYYNMKDAGVITNNTTYPISVMIHSDSIDVLGLKNDEDNKQLAFNIKTIRQKLDTELQYPSTKDKGLHATITKDGKDIIVKVSAIGDDTIFAIYDT